MSRTPDIPQKVEKEDTFLDQALRPNRWEEYVWNKNSSGVRRIAEKDYYLNINYAGVAPCS